MKICAYKTLFLLCLVCNMAFLFAQNVLADNEKKLTENDMVLSDTESALSLREEIPVKKTETSTVFLLLQLVLSLAGVCALIYGVLYLIKRTRRFSVDEDPFLTQLASLSLGPDKAVYVVSLMNKAYLLGSSASSLSLIAEITDKELIDAMSLHVAQTTTPKTDFSSILHTFFPAAQQKRSNPLDSFLTEQRTRLKKARYSDTKADEQNEDISYSVRENKGE